MVFNGKDNREVKQLIIIGNGFDLTCGLESKFSDFYEVIKKKKPNDWNLLHFMATDLKEDSDKNAALENWADIELLLHQILTSMSHSFDSSEPRSQFEVSVIDYIEKKYNLNNQSERWSRYNYRDLNRLTYLEILKKEVTQFEEEFAKYLDITVKTNSEYKQKSNNLATLLSLVEHTDNIALVKDGMKNLNAINQGDIESGKYAANFFSFNYTDVSLEANPYQVQNIHGSLVNKDIILGIDGHDSPDEFLEFTKTYRLLSHTTEKESINFSDQIDYIKIMGHSLGEADYSYFQAIFDGIGLYDSSTKLFFYYQIYNETKREQIIREHYHSVTRLLKTYGATFSSNPEHGKNLIHKLILEKRLVIKEIDCSSFDDRNQ